MSDATPEQAANTIREALFRCPVHSQIALANRSAPPCPACEAEAAGLAALKVLEDAATARIPTESADEWLQHLYYRACDDRDAARADRDEGWRQHNRSEIERLDAVARADTLTQALDEFFARAGDTPRVCWDSFCGGGRHTALCVATRTLYYRRAALSAAPEGDAPDG